MPYDFADIAQEARGEITQAKSQEELEALRVKYLGRNGLLAEITSSIPELEPQMRPEFGKKANEFKNILTALFEERTVFLKAAVSEDNAEFDWTLPGKAPVLGSTHPIAGVMNEICSIFVEMGFIVAEGPEIETEYNNFTGLNIPLEHPSRDAFDTFYLKDKGRKNLLLRSHTSPVQIRVMSKNRPPLAVVVPGKVYRPDAVDASHSFMFHQVEGFLVDEDIKFSDLKGVLNVFVKKMFSEGVKTRFRPHFFPFTEPSAEVDISCIICAGNQKPVTSNQKKEEEKKCSVCRGKGWLEILGCGMIHPNVFKNAGYPEGKYSGFAFGMGVDRIAMLKYGIQDIRLFYENDLRFLRQF